MFNKANVAIALVGAANATAFTPEMGRSLRHGNREKRTPFTTADIPKINTLFGMFDANKDSVIDPKEVWAVYKSNTDETKPENKKIFMKKMDSGLRQFCGAPQKVEATVQTTEAKKANPVSRRGRKGRKGKMMKKMMGKAGKWMKKNGKGKNMFGIFGMMKVHMLYKPFSAADKNGDMKVTPMEMGEHLNKMARKICRKYKMEQQKALSKKWMEAGIPAAELAKMKEAKENMKKEMKKKWDGLKKKMSDRRSEMKKNRGDNEDKWAAMKEKWAKKAKAWKKKRDSRRKGGKGRGNN